jgi:hypothetical protein
MSEEVKTEEVREQKDHHAVSNGGITPKELERMMRITTSDKPPK